MNLNLATMFFHLTGEPLLYLLEMPETNGQVKCEAVEEINPLRLNVSCTGRTTAQTSDCYLSTLIPLCL